MHPTHCSKCGTALMEANILYEIIVHEELIQIEDVPALVCRNCGEEWIEAEVRDNIAKMVREGLNSDAPPTVH